MIYPTTLYNFGKVCKDSATAGNVLRSLCKQAIDLTPSEQVILDMIQNDNEWMNERVDEKREKDRKRQKEWRESHARHALSRDVTVTECDNALSRTLPSFLPSSLPTSLKEYTNRSVPVQARTPAPARTRESAPTERNGNGTGFELEKMAGGMSEAKKRGRAFIDAAAKDQGAFFDPEFDAITICACVTGDWASLKRWRQLVASKGDDAVRQEAFTFWREISAGEDVDNRGAALNRRLGDLKDAKTEAAP